MFDGCGDCAPLRDGVHIACSILVDARAGPAWAAAFDACIIAFADYQAHLATHGGDG